MSKRIASADDGQEPVRSLTSAVFTDLKAEILCCRRRPGEKLHIGNIAKTYDVSLAAVREALSRLVAGGLVVAEDQRGFHVSPASIEDLEDLTQTRIEVECLALRRSIDRGGADWSEAIKRAWEEMSGVKPGAVAWPKRHNRFHAALVGACGLEWLMRFRLVLFEQSERYRSLSRIKQSGARDLVREHRDIMDATLERDADLAMRMLSAHFARTRDLVLTNYAATLAELPRRQVPGRTGDMIEKMTRRAASRRLGR